VKFVVVVGAATKPGRLAKAMAYLAERAGKAADSVQVVDLSQAGVEICDGRPLEQYGADTQAAVAAIQAADAVVFGSPVYRATYPGVLKNLLDHLPVQALRDKPVGIVAMAAGNHHYLGVDSQMRFVLAWFGALTLPNSVYLTNGDFEDGELTSDSGRADLDGLVASAEHFASKLGGQEFGPVPLAAKPW
jgi:FMN reductase